MHVLRRPVETAMRSCLPGMQILEMARNFDTDRLVYTDCSHLNSEVFSSDATNSGHLMCSNLIDLENY